MARTSRVRALVGALSVVVFLPASLCAFSSPLKLRVSSMSKKGNIANVPGPATQQRNHHLQLLNFLATTKHMGHNPVISSDEAKKPPWSTLGALWLVYISNQWSRSLIFYLVSFSAVASAREFMNVDLGFDEKQYSFLASFAFTGLFAVSSLFAGKIADTSNRATLTAGSCALWGLATIAMGLVPSFEGVLGLRVIQGLAMGVTTPAAYGLLSDKFPAAYISTANSLFASAVFFGGGLASLSALLLAGFGWRGTCVAVGSVGLAAAALTLATVSDGAARVTTSPSALDSSNPSGESLLSTVLAIASVPEVQLLFVASALRFCAGFGIGVWSAPFFREKFPDDQAAFAAVNALVVGVGGCLSSLAGGRAADLVAQRSSSPGGSKAARAWLVAGSCFLAVPAWISVIKAPTFTVAMACLFLEYLVAEIWFGPTIALLYEFVDSSRRGTTQGLFSVLTAFGNIAPVAIGAAVSAQVSLSDALALSIAPCYAAAALAFAGAARLMTNKSATEGKKD